MPKCNKLKEGPTERLHEMGAANAGAVDILLSLPPSMRVVLVRVSAVHPGNAGAVGILLSTSTGLQPTYAIGFTGGILFGSAFNSLHRQLLHDIVFRTEPGLLHATVQSSKMWNWPRKSKYQTSQTRRIPNHFLWSGSFVRRSYCGRLTSQ
jgi:hypothetical protein